MFTPQQLETVSQDWEAFLITQRPPVEMRQQIDIGMEIENQSVIIYEIRPQWDHPEVSHKSPIAKVSYIGKSGTWKIYWMRSDLKWYSYSPKPAVKSFNAFLKQVAEDSHCCFWG